MVAIIAGFMDEIWGMAESDAQGEITYTGVDPTSFKKAVTVYTHKGETPQQALIDFPKRLHGMYWARVATSKEVAEKKNVKYNAFHDPHSGQFGSYAGVQAQINAGQGILIQGAIPKKPSDYVSSAYQKPFDNTPLTAYEIRNSDNVLSKLIDKSNQRENSSTTKERIARNIAKKLVDDADYNALCDKLQANGDLYYALWGDNLQEKVASALIHSWAITSGDEDKLSVAIQYAANKEFALKNETMAGIGKQYYSKGSNDFIDNHSAALQKFVRVQYDLTQSYLKTHKITSMIAYRGVSWSNKPPGGKDAYENNTPAIAEVRTHPISSFSVHLNTAVNFAENQYQTLFATRIPASRIMSTAVTGAGCKNEAEIIVLGGKDLIFTYNTTSMFTVSPEKLAGYMKEASGS